MQGKRQGRDSVGAREGAREWVTVETKIYQENDKERGKVKSREATG